MITAISSHMPIDIDIRYQLNPSDHEGIDGTQLYALPAHGAGNTRFRPETASVRFWKAGGNWTVIVAGPLVKKDGKLGAATRQCAFKHDASTPPPAWVIELVEDARERAAQAIKAEP